MDLYPLEEPLRPILQIVNELRAMPAPSATAQAVAFGRIDEYLTELFSTYLSEGTDSEIRGSVERFPDLARSLGYELGEEQAESA